MHGRRSRERREPGLTITLRPQAPNAGKTVRNTATVAGDRPDPNPRDNTSGADVYVEPEADLSIVKSANAASVVAGGTFTYTLLVTNDGPSTAPAVVVDDPLPVGVTVIDTTASQGTCVVGVGVVRAGSARSSPAVRRRRRSPPPSPSAPQARHSSTEASVVGGIFDPRLQNNSSTVSTTVTAIPTALPDPAPQPAGAPALAITKAVNRTTATTADRLTYRVTVENCGSAAANAVVVTDTFGRPVVPGVGDHDDGQRLCARCSCAGNRTRSPRARRRSPSRSSCARRPPGG